jgi:hypothetical protein
LQQHQGKLVPGHVAVLRVVMADMRKGGTGKGGCNITVMIKDGPPSLHLTRAYALSLLTNFY